MNIYNGYNAERNRALQQAKITSYKQTVYETRFYFLVRFFEESGYKFLMVFENDIPTVSSPVVRYPSNLLMNSSCSLCVALRFSSAFMRVFWQHWGVPVTCVASCEVIPTVLAVSGCASLLSQCRLDSPHFLNLVLGQRRHLISQIDPRALSA